MVHQRFLVVSFPAQGHINPNLQFSKQLLRAGAEVTFATIAAAYRRMSEDSVPDGLAKATYSDGYEDFFEIKNIDYDEYMAKLRTHGSRSLGETIDAGKKAGKPFTCVVYATIIPWVASVAREHHVPSVLLWIQPAAVLRICQFYFDRHGQYGNVIRSCLKDPLSSIELPGLPPLTSRDLPSFLHPSTFFASGGLSLLEEHLKILKEDEANSKVLVNTLEALEAGLLGGDPELIAVGPLVRSAINTGDGDLHGCRSAPDCLEWLDSNAEASVVYVSFGSYSVLPKRQVEEIARALLDSGRPFLWVLRKPAETSEAEEKLLVGCSEELERLGKIVTWCPQVEVLSRPATGCFVTHCGWNSTLESVVSGVPVVGCPLWADQATNARLVEGSWGTGVRVEKNAEGIVEAEELRRCLEMVMGDGEAAGEMRRKAAELKVLAREATRDGGSSDKNLKMFLEGLG